MTHVSPLRLTRGVIAALTCLTSCSEGGNLSPPTQAYREKLTFNASTNHFHVEFWTLILLARNVTPVIHGQELFLPGKCFTEVPVSYTRCWLGEHLQASAALALQIQPLAPVPGPILGALSCQGLCLSPPLGLEPPVIPPGALQGEAPQLVKNYQPPLTWVWRHLRGSGEAPFLPFPVALRALSLSAFLLPPPNPTASRWL